MSGGAQTNTVRASLRIAGPEAPRTSRIDADAREKIPPENTMASVG
jgi:hypothetical protein